ncbi:hypothetical protein Y032_0967g3238 [Ancylostoma ceylanicum]|uniref:SCP domain-containing protein n=1 Tax=Ancylostoma ceylanicum TaxID=53326 RepID=A0A016WA07_9BILA|nr:hypothetical protein Y032_0967g3238 [Ancylostoma ceylanicum]
MGLKRPEKGGRFNDIVSNETSCVYLGKSSGKLKVEIPKDCGTPMTVKLRRSLLLAHNRYRSRAARGKYTIKAKKSALKKLPTAARMLVLKYNCSLEQTAMKWANQAQCQMTHSDYDVGENLYAVSGTSTSLESAAEVRSNLTVSPNSLDDKSFHQSATEPWVEEINQFGISSALTQRPGIGHATQVLWGTTETLGCGVIKCKDGGIMVVCQYYPAGNYVGQAMYKSGKPLSECGSGKRKEVAHTKTGLCFSP